MEKKIFHKKMSNSAFDSFEFDDGFLSKMDAEVKKNKKILFNNSIVQENIKPHDNTTEVCNLSFDLKDLNESDFSDFSSKLREKPENSKQILESISLNAINKSNPSNVAFLECLSPIQGDGPSKFLNCSLSSTPIRKNSSPVLFKNEPKIKQTSQATKADYINFEADLFEDWNDDFTNQNTNDKDMITMSQAVQLIEEAEGYYKEQKPNLNQSINLLTGEVVQLDIDDDFFAESIHFESGRGNVSVLKKTVNESVRSDSHSQSKPSAAQKLVFEAEKTEVPSSISDNKEKCSDVEEKYSDDLQNINFSSDDEFFVLTPVSGKVKEVEKNNSKGSMNNCSSIDVSNSSIGFRRKRIKCLKIIESDDSPSPKSRRLGEKKTPRNIKNFRAREFLDSEAEVSGEVDISSDENEEEDVYEKSFLDEESYCTQNCTADMTAKYLQSIKAVGALSGTFKIPKVKPYDATKVFSQIPEEQNTDYEFDSFCVNDIDEEAKTELSELEIAEQILEMDRKKRKRIIRYSSD